MKILRFAMLLLLMTAFNLTFAQTEKGEKQTKNEKEKIEKIKNEKADDSIRKQEEDKKNWQEKRNKEVKELDQEKAKTDALRSEKDRIREKVGTDLEKARREKEGDMHERHDGKRDVNEHDHEAGHKFEKERDHKDISEKERMDYSNERFKKNKIDAAEMVRNSTSKADMADAKIVKAKEELAREKKEGKLSAEEVAGKEAAIQRAEERLNNLKILIEKQKKELENSGQE